MSQPDPEREKTMTIASAGELMRPATRRSFVRTFAVGGTIMMLPPVFTACRGGGGGGGNPLGPNLPAPVTGISFDVRSDVGIFQIVDLLEQVEGLFYTAVVASATFNSFNTDEREVFIDLRDAEVMHREIVRAFLGNQRLPDIRGSINTATLNSMLSSKQNIITSARMFESLGVSGLNGAGKYLQDARNLAFAGKVASVEGRHLAALRELLPPAGVNANTAFASDETIDANGLDIKLEAGEILSRLLATNILVAGTLANPPISNAPTAVQGVPTPNFFPANS
jgi:hypothetical protein